MIRARNSNRFGGAFNNLQVNTVWSKARIDNSFNPGQFRRDVCGNLIAYRDYGNTNSQYGWEIDHKLPVAKGGNDEINNLQALQWQANRRKGDIYPWGCN